jgi:hypothetical protein
MYFDVKKERPTQTTFLQQGSKPPLYFIRSVRVCFHVSHLQVEVSQGDDIHVIKKEKGFILPQFYCMKTHHCPNQIQIGMLEMDSIHYFWMLASAATCHMLPKTPRTIHDGSGLASAKASF